MFRGSTRPSRPVSLLVGGLALALVAALGAPPAVAAAATSAPAESVAAAAPAAAPGWTTLFADDFDGPAGSPVGSAWIPELGTWGTGAADTATDSTQNVFLDGGGHLSIRALRDSSGAWTSGRIITADKSFSAPDGGQLLMTASIKQPNPAQATGYWSAFWALGLDESGAIDWPRTGEIDILEAVNGTQQVFQTFHCDTVDAGACDEPYGLTSGPQSCLGCLTDYRTYSALIDRTVAGAERIEFMVDGVVTFTVEQSELTAEAWDAAIANDYFLILNLAIGGGLPNGVCGCDSAAAPKTSGGTLSVDHVAVYQAQAPEAILASTPTITGTAKVGSALTAKPGTWGPAPVALSYQWNADGVPLAGATASTYTPGSTVVGKRITVTVTGTSPGYATTSRTSAATAAVASGTLTAATPTISGSARVGYTLTANAGTWGPSPVALSYQWRSNGVALSGATAATYKPTLLTIGSRITVTVTGKKTGYGTLTRTSASTAAVTR